MEDSSPEPQKTTALWKPVQTYTMAVICLVIGLAIGYFVRGSASPAPTVAASANATPQQAQDAHAGMGQQAMPSLADMKRMADKQAAPLLTKLKADPKDVDTLNKTAVTYKAAHQFEDAIVYFKKALEIDPKNVPIRTDMASCMYYNGDVDGAIAELQKSLTYDPKHAGTLMNLGIIKWQGKNDAKGAIVEWQTLLKVNPNFPQKAAVEHLIEEAKQTQSVATAAQPKG
ncbi:MAG: tetratricopeptide repeat protein [Candidatus Korobacteraceae bacterium]